MDTLRSGRMPIYFALDTYDLSPEHIRFSSVLKM